VKYELDFYIPEDGILHSHRRENLKPYAQLFSSLSTSERQLLVSWAARASSHDPKRDSAGT
jgi:hypothetical protein